VLHLLGGATFVAKLNLTIQIAMGVALLAGMLLARRGHYRSHGWCQASVVLLNTILISTIMVPSFERQLLPDLRRLTADAYGSVAFAHATLGAVAELLGLFVVGVAGTGLVPDRVRFKNYRLWMRTTLVVWWLAIAAGLATYGLWYGRGVGARPGAAVQATGPEASGRPAARRSGDAAVARVTISNFSFDPPELTIAAGTTVVWTDALGRHSVESADGWLHSDTLVAGGRYEKRFDAPGRYRYFCSFHGTRTGTGMTGTITVR
jgi:plastocyanin/uncharacterized membrane protein YozB (DUF420 family)